MLGAVIGDVTGSRFEWHNLKSKEFELLTDKCFMTDDSYMTIAVADALMNRNDDDADLSAKAIASMQRVGDGHATAFPSQVDSHDSCHFLYLI